MKKAFERISRSIALVLLVTVSFMSCPIPGDSSSLDSPPPPLKLTPGVGTPHSFYLDSQGNYIETETSGPGRTGLVIENNKLAEGVLIYSDDTDFENRVAFVYQNSIVSMFFKKNSNFPHRMAITDGSDVYYAYLSPYYTASHTYHVTFLQNGMYDTMNQIVLSGDIFSLYQNDPELSNSQNQRMANMTIAMGVWGSLYATFEQLNSAPGFVIPRGMFSSVLTKTAKVFTYVAVASAVVAFVVAPVVAFINPAAGLALAGVAIAVGKLSIGIATAAASLALLIDALEDEDSGQSQKLPISEQNAPVVFVTIPYESNRLIKYNENGIHEEFHIQRGGELVVRFYVSGADFSKMQPDPISSGFLQIYDINAPKDKPFMSNYNVFCDPPPVLEVLSKEEFIVKIKRRDIEKGDIGNGKINFGFIFGEESMKLNVNGYTGGFNFRMYADDEPVLYKNMVVIKLCAILDCPDTKSK